MIPISIIEITKNTVLQPLKKDTINCIWDRPLFL
jgi:hypothetical protein